MRVTTTKPAIFSGIFSKLLTDFIAHKHSLGYKYCEAAEVLTQFDNFTLKKLIHAPVLTKDIVTEWVAKRDYESPRTQKCRCTAIRQFAIYLVELGHDAYVLQPQNFTHIRPFTPYIFSHDQIKAIMKTAGNLPKNPTHTNSHITTPVVFQLLYCCGLRISEALSLKLKDVDLENGIITVRESKFDKDRLIPLSNSLRTIFNEYAATMLACATADDYVFQNRSGGKFATVSFYARFRNILSDSGISHGGRGKGPRLHDLRHTFAVHSLQKMIGEGMDIYCVLPVLSTYLGHVKLETTEQYLRLTAEAYPDVVKTVETYCKGVFPEVQNEQTN